MGCHESKSCPRCALPFECKPGNITECQCFGLSFSDPEKMFIADNYADCLCRNCLLAIKQEIKYQSVQEKFRTIHALLNFK